MTRYTVPTWDYQPTAPYEVLVKTNDVIVGEGSFRTLRRATQEFARFLPPIRDTIAVILDQTNTAVLLYWRELGDDDSWWQGCHVGFASLAIHVHPDEVAFYRVLQSFSLPDSYLKGS